MRAGEIEASRQVIEIACRRRNTLRRRRERDDCKPRQGDGYAHYEVRVANYPHYIDAAHDVYS